ncbi:MAG: hypothetical protein WKG07_24025 [Hymenobacter sp.]
MAALGLGAPAVRAQHAQWASKVTAVSSQKAAGKEAFSPEQVLGPPTRCRWAKLMTRPGFPKGRPRRVCGGALRPLGAGPADYGGRELQPRRRDQD